jgi:AraC-like DNA-binding protein
MRKTRSRLAVIGQEVVHEGQSLPQPKPKHGNRTPAGHEPFSALPTATGSLARLAYARAGAAGIGLKPLLRQAGITAREIEDRRLRLTVHRQIRFLNAAATVLRDELLGFRLAPSAQLRELGLVYYVAASSEVLGDALRRVARYCSIVNEGLRVRYVEGRDLRIAFAYDGVPRHLDRHQIEFSMALLVRLCQQLTGVALVPIRVRLAHHREAAGSGMSTYFGSDIGFSARADELTFAAAVRNLPVVSADPYLNELLVAHCEEALSRRPEKRNSFRSAIENAIAPLLPHGKARAGEIAKRLGLSQRTLARRLAAEDLTFSEILEDLRRRLAGHYLADRGLSISRIAWLLGYREISAFTHAFKRWTGRTPRNARLEHTGKP